MESSDTGSELSRKLWREDFLKRLQEGLEDFQKRREDIQKRIQEIRQYIQTMQTVRVRCHCRSYSRLHLGRLRNSVHLRRRSGQVKGNGGDTVGIVGAECT